MPRLWTCRCSDSKYGSSCSFHVSLFPKLELLKLRWTEPEDGSKIEWDGGKLSREGAQWLLNLGFNFAFDREVWREVFLPLLLPPILCPTAFVKALIYMVLPRQVLPDLHSMIGNGCRTDRKQPDRRKKSCCGYAEVILKWTRRSWQSHTELDLGTE